MSHRLATRSIRQAQETCLHWMSLAPETAPALYQDALPIADSHGAYPRPFDWAEPADDVAETARHLRALSFITGTAHAALVPLLAAATNIPPEQIALMILLNPTVDEARQWAQHPPDSRTLVSLLALRGTPI